MYNLEILRGYFQNPSHLHIFCRFCPVLSESEGANFVQLGEEKKKKNFPYKNIA